MIYEKINSGLCYLKNLICDIFKNWKFEIPCRNTQQCFDTVVEWSEIFILSLFIIIALIILLKKYKVFKIISKNLLSISFIVWIIGVVLYIAGFYSPNLTFISVIPRAIISSFKMFAGSNELARVNEHLREIDLYMSLFSMTHLAAACITFMFIFRLIGFKVRSWFNIIICKYRLLLDKNKATHLFWGVKEESLLLAEDIRKNKKTQNDIIIFIDIDNDDDDNSQKKVSLHHITNSITITESEKERLVEIKALVDHCYNGPAYVDTSNECNIFKSLHLKSVGKIIKRSAKRYFYFLSEDQNLNILGALNLVKDKKIPESKIFVLAQRYKYQEIYENYSKINGDDTSKKIEVIDSSYLSVHTLINDKNNLPINFVDIDPDTAKATSPFTSLIIGFGSTGQELFKYLYEFASFVGPDNKKNPFKCYALDRKMNEKRGLIRTSMPEIEDELELIQDTVNSQTFWDNIAKWISELNYIAITLNDDKLSLSLGVALFKYAVRYRINESRLRIVIRLYDSSNDDTMRKIVETLSESVKNENIKISIFGSKKDFLRYDNIISEENLSRAKEFNYRYETISIKYDIKGSLEKVESIKQKLNELESNEQEAKLEKLKEELKNELKKLESKIQKQAELEKEEAEMQALKSNKQKQEELEKLIFKKQWKENFGSDAVNDLKKSISKYHAINEINRRINQNILNALHITTKEILLNIAGDRDRKEKLELFSNYIDYKLGIGSLPKISQKDIDKLETIAMVEHERWVASHKLLGYRPGENKDFVKMIHKDIKPWEELSESTKLYDYIVVKTTIDMLIKEL